MVQRAPLSTFQKFPKYVWISWRFGNPDHNDSEDINRTSLARPCGNQHKPSDTFRHQFQYTQCPKSTILELTHILPNLLTLSLQACTSRFSLPRSASPVQPTTSTSTAGPTHQPQPKTSYTRSNPSTVTHPTARPPRAPPPFSPMTPAPSPSRHLPHRDLDGQEK